MKSDVPFMTEICLATKQQSYHGNGDNFTEKCSYTIVKIKPWFKEEQKYKK